MSTAIVNVCSDPRLDHRSIRAQVGQRLQRAGLAAERIFITNDAGGNVGSAVSSTLAVIRAQPDDVVMVANLHHDECIADSVGLRRPLAESVAQLRALVAEGSRSVPVLTGHIRTADGAIVWTDEATPRYEVIGFRMPRMYGDDLAYGAAARPLPATAVRAAPPPAPMPPDISSAAREEQRQRIRDLAEAQRRRATEPPAGVVRNETPGGLRWPRG